MTQATSLPYDPDDSTSIQRYNNRKLTADKIRQILSKVRNNPGDSARRWIWELLQNAKDIPNEFGGVSVEVTLTDTELTFQHNGKPFTLAQLHSLVQQVSSKSSTNEDEEVTGKFGTGFIATHLLSPKIEVDSVVKLKDGYRYINLTLDRSGNSSEELIDKIGEALDLLERTDDEQLFRPLSRDKIEDLKREDLLHTKFLYRLRSEEAQKAAKNGLKDLVHTLPLALLMNGQKIKRVSINDHGNCYQCTLKPEEVLSSSVSLQQIHYSYKSGQTPSNTVSYYSYSDKEITLIAPIESTGTKALQKQKADAPFLYRDFPLIGSHKFYFPFILNGRDFNPTEDRNGLVLHSKEDVDAKKNRERIEQAFEAAKKFTEELTRIGVRNRELLAFSRLPHEKWEEGGSKEWYLALQNDYRKFLRSMPLVEVNSGMETYLTLNEACIPIYEHGTSEADRLAFFDVVSVFIGPRLCPPRESLMSWIANIGPKDEMDTWDDPEYDYSIDYTLEDLLTRLEDIGDLNGLAEQLKGADEFTWLQNCYDFLVAQNKEKELTQRAIVPNDYGQFKQPVKNTLWKENRDDLLTDYFLAILLQAESTKDWREIIAYRKLINLPFISEVYGLKDLFTHLNDILKKSKGNRAGDDFIFLNRSDCNELIGQILQVERDAEPSDKIRTRLYDHGHALLGLSNEKVVIEHIKEDYFTVATRLFIHAINQKIESCTDIDGLSGALGCSVGEAYKWLDKYLLELHGSDEFRKDGQTARIVPNQYGEFFRYENLENSGLVEHELPDALLSVLLGLNPKEDWKENLVSTEITYRVKDDKTLEVLADSIEAEISSIQDASRDDLSELYKYSEPILNLIEWYKGAEEIETKYFQRFKQKEATLFTQIALGGGKIKSSDILALQDPDTVGLIRNVKASTLSTSQVAQLIETVDSTIFDQVVRQAKELQEEQAHKENMIQIGNRVEEMVEQALITYLPGVKVSQPTGGKGFLDIEIFNPTTKKKYWLELKSYSAGYASQNFLFAPSQAKVAVKNLPNFGICLLERPMSSEEIDNQYIAGNLRYCKRVGDIFQRGNDDYLLHSEIQLRTGTSTLGLNLLGEPRIRVSKKSLLDSCMDFSMMIQDIEVQIS